MNSNHTLLIPRDERFIPARPGTIAVHAEDSGQLGSVVDISRSGIRVVVKDKALSLHSGLKIDNLCLKVKDKIFPCGPAYVSRIENKHSNEIGLAFNSNQSQLIEGLSNSIRPYPYVYDELAKTPKCYSTPEIDSRKHTPASFYRTKNPDLFAKCHEWTKWTNDLKYKELYQRLYRTTATSGLDSRMTMFDPLRRTERVFICFDSNSYLGLHLHPRVIERVLDVVKKFGYGTPSAQVLCGTNRYLRELEVALSEFNGREETLVFPTGFTANIGVIGALIRDSDAVIIDRFSHASLHEGCRSSEAKFNEIYAHNDLEALDELLHRAEQQGCQGKLVATDGVFSMHGKIARLPELLNVCRRHGARILVDDAHGTGVLGDSGKGIEEYFGMEGSVDILMGTFSKTLGTTGGYISGDSELITYLRFFAAAGMFTATLPAALCAGVTEALKIIEEEPDHRIKLWENINYFVPALQQAGFIVPEPVSPIVTVFTGIHALMWEISRQLFDAGIKCGNVMFPAVPKKESILRLTLCSRHSKEDLDYTIDTLTKIGKKYEILHKTEEEIIEIGQATCFGRALVKN